ncbi:MAG TPA: hypothetical protein VH640_22790 [Bryobacteraceae bacterium]|jgi:hypothetical protein
MAGEDAHHLGGRVLWAIFLTWVPLLVLSLAAGQAFGHQVSVPFLQDFWVNIRFLISLPSLVAAEAIVNPKTRAAVEQFVESGIVTAGQLPDYENILLWTMRLRDSKIAAFALFVVSFAPSIWLRGDEFIGVGISNWHFGDTASMRLSPAGWWFRIVSIALYRLFLLRWVWIVTVWTAFLYQVMRLPLRCIPCHPDGAAGLEFVSRTQLFFAPVTFAASATVVGGMANLIAYRSASISDLKYGIAGFCVLAVAALVLPLLVLTPRLIEVKERGLRDYGIFAAAYASAFDQKWIGQKPLEADGLLGTPDIQSLADLKNSHSVVRRMKIVLLDWEILLGLAIPVVLPMVLLIIATTPMNELLTVVKRLVF